MRTGQALASLNGSLLCGLSAPGAQLHTHLYPEAP